MVFFLDGFEMIMKILEKRFSDIKMIVTDIEVEALDPWLSIEEMYVHSPQIIGCILLMMLNLTFLLGDCLERIFLVP